jgi:hypothetical protein
MDSKRDMSKEFEIIYQHANGIGKEKVSKEEITEENKGFDNPPEFPSK